MFRVPGNCLNKQQQDIAGKSWTLPRDAAIERMAKHIEKEKLFTTRVLNGCAPDRPESTRQHCASLYRRSSALQVRDVIEVVFPQRAPGSGLIEGELPDRLQFLAEKLPKSLTYEEAYAAAIINGMHGGANRPTRRDLDLFIHIVKFGPIDEESSTEDSMTSSLREDSSSTEDSMTSSLREDSSSTEDSITSSLREDSSSTEDSALSRQDSSCSSRSQAASAHHDNKAKKSETPEQDDRLSSGGDLYQSLNEADSSGRGTRKVDLSADKSSSTEGYDSGDSPRRRSDSEPEISIEEIEKSEDLDLETSPRPEADYSVFETEKRKESSENNMLAAVVEEQEAENCGAEEWDAEKEAQIEKELELLEEEVRREYDQELQRELEELEREVREEYKREQEKKKNSLFYRLWRFFSGRET